MPKVTATWAGFWSPATRFNNRAPVTGDGNGRIQFNMRGIEVAADVVVTDFTPSANPNLFDKAKMILPNPVSGKIKNTHVLQIGIVQILEYSRMEAVYRANTTTWMGQVRNKTTQQWIQNVTPCYDCATADIPWYDTGHGLVELDLSGPHQAQHQFQNIWINDYPQLTVTPYLNRPGHANNGMPLYQIKKHNKFSVYLFMRELNAARDKTLHRWILKKGTWTTKMVYKALNSDFKGANTWAGNEFSQAGYNAIEDEVEIVEDDTFGTTAFYNLPHRGLYIDADKDGKMGANDNQRSDVALITPLTYWSIDK